MSKSHSPKRVGIAQGDAFLLDPDVASFHQKWFQAREHIVQSKVQEYHTHPTREVKHHSSYRYN